MPNVEHGKPPEDTVLLEIKPGGTQLALPAIEVPDLVVPPNRERGARAGFFDVRAGDAVPSDYQRLSQRYPSA